MFIYAGSLLTSHQSHYQDKNILRYLHMYRLEKLWTQVTGLQQHARKNSLSKMALQMRRMSDPGSSRLRMRGLQVRKRSQRNQLSKMMGEALLWQNIRHC